QIMLVAQAQHALSAIENKAIERLIAVADGDAQCRFTRLDSGLSAVPAHPDLNQCLPTHRQAELQYLRSKPINTHHQTLNTQTRKS
ncbi:MAG: hypothetical protein ACOYNF_17590, partial [Rhodoferax sp.]